MIARIQKKLGRPNYYVVLEYRDADNNRKRIWKTTEIPIKGKRKMLEAIDKGLKRAK